VDKAALDGWSVAHLDTVYRVALHKQISAAYLGVGVESPTATIRSQLRLAEGAGLVVNYVDAEGPSKGLVQEHDVLEKLDEQILVNGEQLLTLVRMHKQGETITLTLIREAKPVTVPIKLGEKQVEALGTARDGNAVFADNVLQAGNLAAVNGLNLIDSSNQVKLTDHVLASVNGNVVNLNDNTNTARALFAIKDLGDGVTLSTQPVIVPQQTGPLTFDDGKTLVLYYLSPAAKPQAITVLDRASGKMMFSGPAGTEEQWKAVPEDVRQKITTWRDMLKQVNGTPDPATKPAEK
jgi:serine protease Do